MAELDMVIRGGRLVAPGLDAEADLGILRDKVDQIGGEMRGQREVDARGLLVLPGGVDAHVHVTIPPGTVDETRWVDDFTSGSRAALAGGITTIGNMSFPAAGEGPLETLDREWSIARPDAIADYVLHPVIREVTSTTLEEIPQLLAVGCNTIKVFLVMPEFEQQVPQFVQAVGVAGDAGLLTMIHCEDHGLISDLRRRLDDQGRTSLRHYPKSAPPVTEAVAVQRAVAIAEVTGAPVYIVHLSSARALEVCVDAQMRGLPVYVETRPLYLHLTAERFEEPEGGKYVGQPPLRSPEDVAALWAGIRQGVVHTVCSDHAPYSLAAKLDAGHTVLNLRAGVENLQFLRPMLYSEGVGQGRLSLDHFIDVTATNAAKLLGLFPRKGTIAPGSDADIVLWDSQLTRTIDRAMILSNADYSVYEGWEVTGWPVLTIRRGEIVYDGEMVTATAGSGEYLRRSQTRLL